MKQIGLVVLVGSERAGRFAPVVAQWFVDRAAARSEFAVDVVDLADVPLPVDLSENEVTAEFARRIGAADAFVVVTPEYNHGYPGALKTALDSVKYQWRGKPIGFVSYGGVSGGLRAVEQLRQVAAELHMVSVRDAVSFHRARKKFDASGSTTDSAAVDASDRMLDQLRWWAALSADSDVPYPG